jgi:predicted Zn-dependent protease
MRTVKFYLIYAVMAIASFGAFSGCESGTGIGNLNLFSPEEDAQMGAQLDTEIRNLPNEYPIYNNPTATQYLQSIMDEILQSDQIKYREVFTYKVTIIESETINAFATPGGYVYFYTGMLKFLENEAMLASVMAHEIAHAERRHATKRMTKQMGLSVLLSVVLGNNPAQLAEIAANLFTGLEFLRNSREDEAEADEYSFKYLLTSKWYPGAGKLFFELVAKGGTTSAIEELLSTHPPDEKRIAAIEAMLIEHNIAPPTEANLFAQKYLQFKQTLN